MNDKQEPEPPPEQVIKPMGIPSAEAFGTPTALKSYPVLAVLSRFGGTWQITALLECFSQLLQETEHFCRWRQEKVAKIVQYGPPFHSNNLPLVIIR